MRVILGEFPRLMQAGLGLVVLGAVLDIAYHVGTDAHDMEHSSIAWFIHTSILIGMVVTMLGLVAAAFNRHAVEAQPTRKGESR
jgi:hypothetical protein